MHKDSLFNGIAELWDMANNELGTTGENMGVSFLKKEGFTILERNWRFGKAEIDIIASKEELMVFVEVKMRSSNHYGSPWQAVVKNKQTRIIKAADHYLKKTQWQGEARFDIISIVGSGVGAQLTYLKAAFYPLL